MDKFKFLKESANSKLGLDNDKQITFGIERSERTILPDCFSGDIDSYEQYLKEKDECRKFHFTFTLNPVCSNILFNKVTEIVKDEGGKDVKYFGKDKKKFDTDYKKGRELNRQILLDDTTYSHPEIGRFVYHCGLDIFSNHWLRHKYFNVVNKVKDDAINNDFNTIADTNRLYEGYDVISSINDISKSGTTNYHVEKITGCTHQYMYDGIYTFKETIQRKLVEEDGWIGFINPSTIEVENFSGLTINKCMNNNKHCEFYDLYPDRSLFSMTPKINKYRNRIEPNWEYCLTYPYSSYTNSLVECDYEDGKVNGLEAKLISNPLDVFSLFTDANGEMNGFVYNDMPVLKFSTIVKNGLKEGDFVEFDFFDYSAKTGGGYDIINMRTVTETVVGVNDDYTFYVNGQSFDGLWNDGNILQNTVTREFLFNVHVRIRKIVNSIPCEYYIRLFRKLPKLRNIDSNQEFDENVQYNIDNNEEYVSSLNNLAFSKNIFGDTIGQIVYNDEVNVEGFKDNLGRPISELYLTVIKSNGGYKEWYENNNKSGDTVTFSHCFGKITSGFDLPYYINDYNVRKIHNIDVDKLNTDYTKSGYTDSDIRFDKSPNNLEENKDKEITINGDTYLDTKGLFFGDLVEFSVADIKETTLEDVYFRFNTAQREYTKDTEFADITYNDINTDDYDVRDLNDKGSTSGFTITATTYNEIRKKNENDNYKFFANLDSEGYFYKPHFKIKLFEYNNVVKQGNHKSISFGNFDYLGEDEGYRYYTITTAVNYFFEKENGLRNSLIQLFIDDVENPVDGIVTNIEKYTKITFKVDKDIIKLTATEKQEKNGDVTITYNFEAFRYNDTMPDIAYELNDGTGRYLWADRLKENQLPINHELYDRFFTNGRIYIHDQFNIYLRRQDPVGDYGLNFSFNEQVPSKMKELCVGGENIEITDTDSNETIKNADICGLDVSSVTDTMSNSVLGGITDIAVGVFGNIDSIISDCVTIKETVNNIDGAEDKT